MKKYKYKNKLYAKTINELSTRIVMLRTSLFSNILRSNTMSHPFRYKRVANISGKAKNSQAVGKTKKAHNSFLAAESTEGTTSLNVNSGLINNPSEKKTFVFTNSKKHEMPANKNYTKKGEKLTLINSNKQRTRKLQMDIKDMTNLDWIKPQNKVSIYDQTSVKQRIDNANIKLARNIFSSNEKSMQSGDILHSSSITEILENETENIKIEQYFKSSTVAKTDEPNPNLLEEDLSYLTKSSKNRNGDKLTSFLHEMFQKENCGFKTFSKIEFYRKKIEVIVRSIHPDCRVYVTGSGATGCVTKKSDCDMCIVRSLNISGIYKSRNSRNSSIPTLVAVRKILRKTTKQYPVLIKAKVPILRFWEKSLNLEVDISCDSVIAPANTRLLKFYVKIDPRFRELVSAFKKWALSHNVDEAFKGNLSSYSYSLLTLFFLQNVASPPVLPNLHKIYPEKMRIDEILFLDSYEFLENYRSENTQTIGELFKEMISFYHNFDFESNVLFIADGVIEDRTISSHQLHPVVIIEPFSGLNTAGSLCPLNYKSFKRCLGITDSLLKNSYNIDSNFRAIFK